MKILTLLFLTILSTFAWAADVTVRMTPPTFDQDTGEPIPVGTLWGATIVWNRLDPTKADCWEALQPISDVLLYTPQREAAENTCWNASVVKGESAFADVANPTMTSYEIPNLEFGIIRVYKVSWQYKADSSDLQVDQDRGRVQTGRRWSPAVLFAPATDPRSQPGLTVITVGRSN